jgi:hypothetical protein
MTRCTHPPHNSRPELSFRIVHLTLEDGHASPYQEQTAEIALDVKGMSPGRTTRRLKRRVPPEKVVSAVRRRKKKPARPRVPRTPPVVDSLRRAMRWQKLLSSGEVASRAEIARLEGLTRARVTQIFGLLRLAAEVRQRILRLPPTTAPRPLSERSLRPLIDLPPARQLARFRRLSGES